MSPCGDRFRRICCATLGSAGSPLTCQGKENLTGASIGDPTEKNGKGTEGTAPVRNRSERAMGTAQDVVTEDAVTLVGASTRQTTEVNVREGILAITPTPLTRTYRGCGAEVITVGTEVGRSIKKY